MWQYNDDEEYDDYEDEEYDDYEDEEYDDCEDEENDDYEDSDDDDYDDENEDENDDENDDEDEEECDIDSEDDDNNVINDCSNVSDLEDEEEYDNDSEDYQDDDFDEEEEYDNENEYIDDYDDDEEEYDNDDYDGEEEEEYDNDDYDGEEEEEYDNDDYDEEEEYENDEEECDNDDYDDEEEYDDDDYDDDEEEYDNETKESYPGPSSTIYNSRRIQPIRTYSSYDDSRGVDDWWSSNYGANSSKQNTNRQSNLSNLGRDQGSIRYSQNSFNQHTNDYYVSRNNNSSNLASTEKTHPKPQHTVRRRSKRGDKQLSPPILRLLKLVYNGNSLICDDQRIAFHYYKNLNTKLRLMQPNEPEYKTICNYLENTHGPTHNFTLSIENIYVSYRLGAFKEFKENKKLGNRKLLWHGTKLSNFASILSNGLLTKPPSHAGTNGKMFGNGIYFADVVTKAAQYCKVDRSNPYGILILAQVALGKQYIKTESEHISQLPYGKNSVKALGKYQPKRNECIRTKYGMEIPLGTPTLQPNLQTSLFYNEYIVYDMNQIFFEYLVLVKFDF